VLDTGTVSGGPLLTWRELREDDLEACLAAPAFALGDAIVGVEKASEIWRELLRNPAFVARVIEAETPGQNRHIVNFGASAFVRPEFLNAEIVDPRPGLNSRIIAGLAAGAPVLLTREEIATANAGNGLDAVFLSFVWWHTSTPIEFAEMMMACIGSCVEAHAGYRLRSATVECPGVVMRMIEGHSGEFEIIREFKDLDVVWMRMTRERASVVAASASNLLFQYHAPLLGFSASEQQLLTAALGGAVDRELAASLGLTLPVVKRRWRSIFETIQDRMPDMFAEIPADDERKRGPQKRHLVLSYVRRHPEELRPYRADRTGSALRASR
jgi:hypothetical protein